MNMLVNGEAWQPNWLKHIQMRRFLVSELKLTVSEPEYRAKNEQVATSLLTSCNYLLQQADTRIGSHGLRQPFGN